MLAVPTSTALAPASDTSGSSAGSATRPGWCRRWRCRPSCNRCVACWMGTWTCSWSRCGTRSITATSRRRRRRLRVVRRSNLPDSAECAAVLTDVIEIDGRPWVKPLVIGLSNRHNVLYDLARRGWPPGGLATRPGSKPVARAGTGKPAAGSCSSGRGRVAASTIRSLPASCP